MIIKLILLDVITVITDNDYTWAEWEEVVTGMGHRKRLQGWLHQTVVSRQSALE